MWDETLLRTHPRLATDDKEAVYDDYTNSLIWRNSFLKNEEKYRW